MERNINKIMFSKHRHGLTYYEILNLNIIENAIHKLIASAELYKTKYAYTSSYYLAVIAEEELAKLIMLPIAKELNEIDELLRLRNSIYYNHSIKQKIFTSYGLQNRSYKQIEKLKQKCLYVGVNDKFEPIASRISPKETLNELTLAFTLVTDFIQKIILGAEIISQKYKCSSDFSNKFCKIVTFLLSILRGFIDNKIPEIKKEVLMTITKKEKRVKTQLKKTDPKYRKVVLLPMVLSNPYALIDFFKALYGKKMYKFHLQKIKNKNYNGIKSYLIKNYNIKE